MYVTEYVTYYPLSLHDALPIFHRLIAVVADGRVQADLGRLERLPVGHVEVRAVVVDAAELVDLVVVLDEVHHHRHRDRKSTRLNSSHPSISYAVFCLKKKKHHQ